MNGSLSPVQIQRNVNETYSRSRNPFAWFVKSCTVKNKVHIIAIHSVDITFIRAIRAFMLAAIWGLFIQAAFKFGSRLLYISFPFRWMWAWP